MAIYTCNKKDEFFAILKVNASDMVLVAFTLRIKRECFLWLK